MGQSKLWWWQLHRPRSAQQCSEALWHTQCFCCNLGRWKRRDMGPFRPWWWQLQCPGSAQACAADPWHTRCFCRNSGRWNSGDLGQCFVWWWLLQCPRSAKKCAADLWHTICFCCNCGRWNHSDMGQSKVWWWLLHSPRPVQIYLRDSKGVSGRVRRSPAVRFSRWLLPLGTARWAVSRGNLIELETNVHSFILLAIRSHYFCCVLLVVLDTECCAFVWFGTNWWTYSRNRKQNNKNNNLA